MKILEIILLLRKTFFTNFIKIYYSQFGEDVVLKELIKKKKNGFYVDVGCYHPKKFSNTYYLRSLGWKGINIDMEENKIFMFKVARPNDYNVVAAVSDTIENVYINKVRNHSLVTKIDKQLSSTSLGQNFSIKTQKLTDIIERSPFYSIEIDVLSIDCEGHDFNVIKSLDIDRYKPKILIIEDHSNNIELIIKGELYNYLVSKEYILKSWCVMSLIFVRKNSEFFN